MKQSIFELGQLADRAMNNDLTAHLDAYCADREAVREKRSEATDEIRDWLRKVEDAAEMNNDMEYRACLTSIVMCCMNAMDDES